MRKYWLQSMAVESAIRKIRKIKVFKKWKLQSMDCNQDYYHSQYWLQPDYYGNMDTMNYSNNYDWYICSVLFNLKANYVLLNTNKKRLNISLEKNWQGFWWTWPPPDIMYFGFLLHEVWLWWPLQWVCDATLLSKWRKGFLRLSHPFVLFEHCVELVFSFGINFTMRTNLLNWCHLVSISKNVVFYTFLVVRIY